MSNEELVAAIQAGDTERIGALWEQVAGLCCWKAKQVMTALDLRGSSCGVELDDLMQTGYIALAQAVETYQPEHSAFSTWYVYYLKKAFAELTGFHTKQGRLEPLNTLYMSMDAPVSDETDSADYGAFIPDGKAAAVLEAVEDREYREQLHDTMERMLAAMPDNCREVLRLRYYRDMTLSDCGELLGVGAERVRQMECRGLRFLRRPQNAATLYSFYDFNFYAGTGAGAFSHSGMSVQERYLIVEEERREREAKRRAEKQAKQQNAVDIATQRAEERLAAMTPEEKQRLLAAYGYA